MNRAPSVLHILAAITAKAVKGLLSGILPRLAVLVAITVSLHVVLGTLASFYYGAQGTPPT